MNTQSPVNRPPPVDVPALPPLLPANTNNTESEIEPSPAHESPPLANGDNLSTNNANFQGITTSMEGGNGVAPAPNSTKTDNTLAIASVDDTEIGDADEVAACEGIEEHDLPDDGCFESKKTKKIHFYCPS